ncbi:MAG: methyltransferase domain-containing protein [Pseudomonadota bacterium]
MTSLHCHICDSKQTKGIAGLSEFGQVSSDCRPWPRGAELIHCEKCGTVQKVLTDAWQKDIEKIYAEYQIYPQASGAEQKSFDLSDGSALSRSAKILLQFSKHHQVPAAGKMLDFGCGNGAMLSSFGNAYPQWDLSGMEFGDKYRDHIMAFPGVSAFYDGQVDEVPEGFDVITLIHSLEHVPHPIELLKTLESKLAPQGMLIIQVPYFAENPFDLLVADHCSHFTPESLENLACRAGLKIEVLSSSWVPRELSMVVTRASETIGVPIASGSDLTLGERQLAWLDSLVTEIENIETPEIGIFGASIAATWVASMTKKNVAFFLDEDPTRIGHQHLGAPIISPSDCPAGARVVLPFVEGTARAIANRLSDLPIQFVAADQRWN